MIFPEHARVGLPEVAVGIDGPIGFGNAHPELAATVRASSTHEPGDDLPGAAAQCNPYPAGAGLALDERPQLVESRTSPGWTGTRVVSKSGKLWAFF